MGLCHQTLLERSSGFSIENDAEDVSGIRSTKEDEGMASTCCQ